MDRVTIAGEEGKDALCVDGDAKRVLVWAARGAKRAFVFKPGQARRLAAAILAHAEEQAND